MTKPMYRLALAVTVASLFLFNVSLFASETDDRIESSVKQSYVYKTYLRGDDIRIHSRDGLVTLTGTVSGESNKLLAQEIAAGMPGVKSVDNRLELKDEVPAVHTDRWIVGNVKSRLMFHQSINSATVEISVMNGNVTLRGEAVSAAQKDLVTEYAGDVECVKNVTNEMTVLSSVPDKKTADMSDSIDDASITAVVRTMLFNRSTKVLRADVETRDGVVTLDGSARNAAEKELATKLAGDVYGVKRVVNNMTIE